MRSHVLKAALVGGALALFSTAAQAQIGPELLVNGTLEAGSGHELDTSTGWTLTEGSQSGATVNSATFASFANNTPTGIPAPGVDVGLWYRGFAGGPLANPDYVFADLTQTVAGTPGQLYRMRAFSRFETNWPGGVPDDITDTVIAMDFLDAGSTLISSSVLELAADGQTNGGGWRQHTLGAVAPGGTAFIRARASMINGHVAAANPQSAFMDDFSLRAVPEPTTLGLASIAGLGLMVRRRK